MFQRRKGLPRWLSSKQSVCNAGDTGSIPGLGRSPREGNGNNILAWEIPWTEEHGWLQFMGSQRVGYNLATKQQQQQIRKHTAKLNKLA